MYAKHQVKKLLDKIMIIVRNDKYSNEILCTAVGSISVIFTHKLIMIMNIILIDFELLFI